MVFERYLHIPVLKQSFGQRQQAVLRTHATSSAAHSILYQMTVGETNICNHLVIMSVIVMQSQEAGTCHGKQVAGGLTELKLHISHGETI